MGDMMCALKPNECETMFQRGFSFCNWIEPGWNFPGHWSVTVVYSESGQGWVVISRYNVIPSDTCWSVWD